MPSFNFDAAFKSLTGNPPFPWQRRLFESFVIGTIPDTCELPTGLGKTSVIAIWLLARAAGAALPRRLVYVVNRRTVVDQTTTEVERLRTRLDAAGIREPLAVSTLRGQFADNREWSEDPSRAAVICGTVDMVGSRLLFSGYGLGFKTRPLHAGFLGQDVLLIHDEAHLEPAFQALVETIVGEQKRCGDPWPMRLMALSATVRTRSAQGFRLDALDERHPVVSKRFSARKKLTFHQCPDKELVDHVVEHVEALGQGNVAILVFLRTVDDVIKTVGRLQKSGYATQCLTGTMRGYEREQLAATDPVFRRFLPTTEQDAPDKTVVLVSTSAGEVGVSLSADHLICDLSTFDAMAQRFGQVNRFGARQDSEVRVLHPEESLLLSKKRDSEDAGEEGEPQGDSLDERRLRTLRLLRQLDDVSPRALGNLDPSKREAAFAPSPCLEPATEILFDAWTMTTIRERMPGRPPVTTYLHGIQPWEPPTTRVAWRDEVDMLPGIADLLAKDLLEDYPLKSIELLQDTSRRMAKTISGALTSDPSLSSTPAWIVTDDGEVHVTTLGKLTARDAKTTEAGLANCTLLLPARSSRPVNGLLTTDSWTSEAKRLSADVADWWGRDAKGERRVRVLDSDHRPVGMRLIRSISLGDESIPTADDRAERRWDWYERPHGADDEGSRSATNPVLLDVHAADVERWAQKFVAALALPESLSRAVVAAARHHDQGKCRQLWQRSIGNSDPSRVFAKSGWPMRALDVTTFRHELGSVVDAVQRELLAELSADERDLALHLIAAHHGRARPHFPSGELFDPESEAAELGQEVMERFVRLQRRFGRWGLAYLESLVRAADYAASAEPSSFELYKPESVVR